MQLLVRLTRPRNFSFILRCKKSFKESSDSLKTVQISFREVSQKTGQKYDTQMIDQSLRCGSSSYKDKRIIENPAPHFHK